MINNNLTYKRKGNRDNSRNTKIVPLKLPVSRNGNSYQIFNNAKHHTDNKKFNKPRFYFKFHTSKLYHAIFLDGWGC
jgi:hypothetical protein